MASSSIAEAFVKISLTEEAGCEETYGIFPCSSTIPGTLFLVFVYGKS
jgi:hypothetical protein